MIFRASRQSIVIEGYPQVYRLRIAVNAKGGRRQPNRKPRIEEPRIVLEAAIDTFLMAFAGTALVTFSYGFLENVGYAKLSMFAVWPLMAGFWTIGLIVANLRYR